MARTHEGPSWRLQRIGEQEYLATAELGRHPKTGKRWTASHKVKGTRAIAKAAGEAWFDALCLRHLSPDLVGRSEQPLSRYLASWHEAKRGTIKESTWRRYESLIAAMLPTLGDVRLCDLTAQHVQEYVGACLNDTDKPISPKTLANRLGVLNAACAQALREELLTRNPMLNVSKPRCTRSRLRTVGEHEAAVIRRAAEGTDLDALVHLALGTGARLGELLALRWRDMDFERSVLHITRTLYERPVRSEDWYDFTDTKGSRGRCLDLDAGTVAALRRHKARQSALRVSLGKAWQDHGLVFANTWQLRSVAPGSPIRVSTISRQYRTLADKAGLSGVRFHDLRHAHATIMLRAGVPVHVVAARLGHSDPALTLRVYAHVLPGQQADAAELVGAAIDKALAAL